MYNSRSRTTLARILVMKADLLRPHLPSNSPPPHHTAWVAPIFGCSASEHTRLTTSLRFLSVGVYRIGHVPPTILPGAFPINTLSVNVQGLFRVSPCPAEVGSIWSQRVVDPGSSRGQSGVGYESVQGRFGARLRSMSCRRRAGFAVDLGRLGVDLGLLEGRSGFDAGST